MTKSAPTSPQPAEPSLLEVGLKLQEGSMALLLAEIQALQAMIPVGERELPSDAETEAGFDNMPV